MNKSLAHLPEEKQDELELIKDIILEKIPDVRMIVLFGSYARGDWVEDTHVEDNAVHVYESDYDILVATKTEKMAENLDVHSRVENAIEATGKVKTPYGIIYHTFTYIKNMITEGHYFFADIKREGKHLYRKSSKHRLGKIKILTPAERKQIAEEHFKQWFKSAKEFFDTYHDDLNKRRYKKAAFELHQATERFYSAVTLVFVNYRFRTHDLEKLGRKAVSYNAEFAKVFPCATKEEEKAYELLKKAYIDARYKKEYRITRKQLEYLGKRVKVLQRLTKKICKEKIESFV